MSKRSEPAISLATLRDDARDQAKDLEALTRAQARHDAAIAELDPRTYAKDHIAERQAVIRKELRAKVDPIMTRIAERKARALEARAAWQPERRRLDASLSDPVTAAALSSRLALVSVTELPRLAEEAAARGDWMLADAVVSRAGQLSADQNALQVGTAIRGALEGMDRDAVREVRDSLAVIGRDYTRAQIINAELEGKPLTPAARLTMIREFPEAPIPAPA